MVFFYILNSWGCWTFFHVLISHLSLLFNELFLYILSFICPFSNWLFVSFLSFESSVYNLSTVLVLSQTLLFIHFSSLQQTLSQKKYFKILMKFSSLFSLMKLRVVSSLRTLCLDLDSKDFFLKILYTFFVLHLSLWLIFS